MARRVLSSSWQMSPANKQQMHTTYRQLLRAATRPKYRTITLEQRQSSTFPAIDLAVMQAKMKANIRTAFRVDRLESAQEFENRMNGCSKLNEMLHQLYALRLDDFCAMFRKVQESQAELTTRFNNAKSHNSK